MRRLLVLLLSMSLLAPAAAVAQQSPFGPLPPAAPAQTPTPQPVNPTAPDDDDIGRGTLFLIALGVLAVFIGIGAAIMRDARRTVGGSPEERDDPVRPERGPQARARAKKQRHKQKIAKQSRRKNR